MSQENGGQSGDSPPEDALSEGPPTGHDESAPAAEDVDFDQALSGLQDIESSRRMKGTILGIGALVALFGAFFAIYQFRTFLFRPDLPIQETERQLIDKTDDPQCRNMIAKVTQVREEFFALESSIEAAVPAGSDERRQQLSERLDELVTQLDEAEALSHRANFRHEHSASEVDDWFRYTRGRLVALRDFVAPGDPAEADAGLADAASEKSGDATADAASDDVGPVETAATRRNDLLFTTHNSFDKFRVWHSSERYEHPCGDAAETETPWRPKSDVSPSQWEASAGEGGAPALDASTAK